MSNPKLSASTRPGTPVAGFLFYFGRASRIICEGIEPKIISRAEAKRLGLKAYFTGKACSRGHICARWTCGQCMECGLERQRWRRKERPELAWESNRKWLIKNPSYLAIKLEKQRKKYAENAEHAKARRESGKKWRDKNLDRYCAYAHKRRAKIIGSSGTHTASEVKELLVKQRFKCANSACRASIKRKYHRDHIVPLDLGGSNWISNMQLLCPPCNLKKGAKDPIGWAQEHGRLI